MHSVVGYHFVKNSCILRRALLLTTAMVAITSLPTAADTIEWDAGAPTGNGTVESASGDWNSVDTLWTSDGGATNIAFVSGDEVVFGDIGAVVTITDPSVDPNSIAFNVTGYEITSGAIETGTGLQLAVTTAGDSAVISSALSGNGTVTVTGDGMLSLSGASTATGTLVNQGNLTVSSTYGGAVSNTQALTLDGATLGDVLIQTAGTTTVSGMTEVSGLVDIDDGTVTVMPGATLTALSGVDIAADGTVSLDAGSTIDVTGDLLIAGTLEGAAPGTSTVTADSLSLSGSFDVDAGEIINVTVENLVVTSTGGVIGDGTVSFNATNIMDSGATAVVTEGTAVNYQLGGASNLMTSGNLTVTGTFTQGSSTVVMISPNFTFSVNELVNSSNFGGILVGAGATLNGTGAILGNAGNISVDNTGTITSAGALANESTGTITFNGSGTLTSDSDVVGDEGITNDGLIEFNGGAGTNVIVSSAGAGTFANQSGGTITVADGSSVTFAGTGGVTNLEGGTLNVNGGTVAGNIANQGAVNFSGTLNGDVMQAGTNSMFTANGAPGQINGTLTLTNGQLLVNSTATMGVSGGVILGADADAFVFGTLNANFTNDGDLGINDGTINGNLTGTGNVFVSGTSSMTGNVGQNGSSDGMVFNLNSVAGDVTDSFTINGALSGNNTFNLDVITGAPGTNIDTIRLSDGSMVDGVNTINFFNTGTALQLTEVDFIFGGTGQLSLDNFLVGMQPFGGLTVTELSISQGSQNIAYSTTANPAIGGIVGSVTTTGNMLNTVVNRPAQPFVSSAAYDEESDACGTGAWGRVLGGRAVGTSDTTDPRRVTPTDTDIDYTNISAGTDFGCFDGRFGGWDITSGALFSYSSGTTSSEITNIGNIPASLTTGTFEQVGVGIYATAINGPWLADMLLTQANTTFRYSNAIVGLNESELEVDATTFTLAGSYAHPVSEDGLLTFTPGAGFSVSRSTYSALDFGGVGSLQIGDTTSTVVFASGTLARTFILDGGNAIGTLGATLSAFSNISDDVESSFLIAGSEQNQTTTTLGTFGEFSVGYSYAGFVNFGTSSPLQLNAQLRGDVRFGERLEGYGITAELRLQF